MRSSKVKKRIYMKTAPQRKDDYSSEEEELKKKKSTTSQVELPDAQIAFKFLLWANLAAALFCHITDCDETYNYWEPLHHFIYGEGFQTWEYSPDYAIRSWAYILIHYSFTIVHFGLLNSNRIFVFYFIRMILAVCCTICQVHFLKGIAFQFGNNVHKILLIFLIFSTGMFIANVAFLPSSFCMYMTYLFVGFWLLGQLNRAILSVAAAGIIGWPFGAALGLPLAVDVLIRRKKFWFFIKWCLVALLTMLLPCAVIDSIFYGKLVVAPLNIIIYNVFTQHGPNIYGTEGFSFYFLNGFLNFNFVFILALFSAVIICISELAIKLKGHQSRLLLPIFIMSPMYLWMLIFFLQPHKEERFLFPIYPLICLNAALALATFQKVWCIYKLNKYINQSWISNSFIVIFTTIAISRTVALYLSYHAPMDIYKPLHNTQFNSNFTKRVCLGKEWHRFPSSFILPSGFEARFIESEFRGQLPAKFTTKGLEGTSDLPSHFNDANLEEKGRYVEEYSCDFLVDYNNGVSSELEKEFSKDLVNWKVINEIEFLDKDKSKSLYRVFYVPFYFWRKNTFGKYQLLLSKDSEFE